MSWGWGGGAGFVCGGSAETGVSLGAALVANSEFVYFGALTYPWM